MFTVDYVGIRETIERGDVYDAELGGPFLETRFSIARPKSGLLVISFQSSSGSFRLQTREYATDGDLGFVIGYTYGQYTAKVSTN